MRIAILISYIVPFIHAHGYDLTCPDGKDSSQTILVGRGESYSLTFNPTKKSNCKVIYQPLSNDPTSCKTGLRFSCSKFVLPNTNAKKCSNGAKLATNARRRPYCKGKKPIIETKGKKLLKLMFSSIEKANAFCSVECKDEVVPTEPKSDLIIRINTTTWAKTMYGPWSDERLSAFEFNITENAGSAALGFSPCYDCPIAYQLKLTDNEAQILVDSSVVKSQTISGILSTDYVTTVRIQTIPMSKGQFEFKVDIFPNGTLAGNKITYTSSENTIPFGITYAVFGDESVDPAKYAFRDVDRLPKVFPIADCREGLNTGFTAFAGNDSVTVSSLVIEDPVSINTVDLNQLWCIVTKKDPCNYGNCRKSASNRNHIETENEGMIRNIGTCQYIKADPSQDGEVKMIVEADKSTATQFNFVKAPNTEISQIRFQNSQFVLAYEGRDFLTGLGPVVAKAGNSTFPLASCFKPYNFLSNVLSYEL